MTGLDAIYDQRGWSLVRRYAIRQKCPFCRSGAGQGCTKVARSNRRYLDTLRGVHASRVALASYCEEHGAEMGERCDEYVTICESRTLLAGELISNDPSLAA